MESTASCKDIRIANVSEWSNGTDNFRSDQSDHLGRWIDFLETFSVGSSRADLRTVVLSIIIRISHCDWPPERARWSYLARSGYGLCPARNIYHVMVFYPV